MGSRDFKVNIIIRIVLLVLVMSTIAFFFVVSQQYLRGSYFALLLIFQLIEFFRYVDKTNRDLSNFFLLIKEHDFASHFKERGKGESFEMLYESMNSITKEFKKLSTENEVQFNFLSMLVNHLKVGILSFDVDEKIHLMNPALQDLLNKPMVATLEQLAGTKEMLQVFRKIKPGENKLISYTVHGNPVQLAIHASEFRLEGHYYKLLSMQNVKHELEENELQAWQKLIRVLTHEIMNSVAPITSLTDTLIDISTDLTGKGAKASGKEIENITKGLEAIKIRSSGLHTFTEAYQSLTKLPEPHFDHINTSQFISPILILLDEELAKKRIDLHLDNRIPEDTMIIDKELMGQVIINLLKNAIEAVPAGSKGEIKMTISKSGDSNLIEIYNSGPAIPQEIQEKIFIPFFTTKQGGSGIGLALSRQIVHAHNGRLDYSSDGSGTRFTIRF